MTVRRTEVWYSACGVSPRSRRVFRRCSGRDMRVGKFGFGRNEGRND
jgi:hypothetical protein